jgi:hypothetical protein
VAQPVLADHGADLRGGDAPVLRTAGERGLLDLGAQRGEVVPDELHEQARRVLAQLEAVGGDAGPEPRHHRTAGRARHGHDRAGRHRLEQPVTRRQLLVGEDQERGRRIRRAEVGDERLGLARAQGLDATRGHEPPLAQERQGQRRARDAVGARLARLEHLAGQRGGAGIREERARHVGERVLEQQRLRAVEQEHGRDRPALHELQEGVVGDQDATVR